jgi:hypothetical protein
MITALVSVNALAANLHVKCGPHRSLGAALASLNPYGPNTVTVSGTCTEVVDLQQFDHLVIMGDSTAVIASTSTTAYTLSIRSSHDVVLRNLTLRGQYGALFFEGCKDCAIYNSTVEGGLVLGSISKAVIFKNVFHANSWTAIGVFDNSVAFINDCSLDTPNNAFAGVYVGKGAVVTLGGATIRGFMEGLFVNAGYLDITGDYTWELPGANPDQTVSIENSLGPGISVNSGGTANLSGITRLRNNGTSWWTASVTADGNSILNIADGVEISNSATDGIQLTWGSHASIGAAKISNYGMNCCGNGISLSDNSTAVAGSGSGSLLVISGGPGQDILCDDSGRFGGIANVSASKITCQHVK